MIGVRRMSRPRVAGTAMKSDHRSAKPRVPARARTSPSGGLSGHGRQGRPRPARSRTLPGATPSRGRRSRETRCCPERSREASERVHEDVHLHGGQPDHGGQQEPSTWRTAGCPISPRGGDQATAALQARAAARRAARGRRGPPRWPGARMGGLTRLARESDAHDDPDVLHGRAQRGSEEPGMGVEGRPWRGRSGPPGPSRETSAV